MTNTLQYTLIFTFAIALLSGCISDQKKYPEPSASFTPKRSYAVSNDKLWQAILDALDKNRVPIASSDKSSGIIQTDYIAGQERLMVLINTVETTRYKYNIRLRNETDGTVRVNVICSLEDTMNNSHGSNQWHDVTAQNTAFVTKLESWLYEQIEKEISP